MGALEEMEGNAEADGKKFTDIKHMMEPAGVKSAYENVK